MNKKEMKRAKILFKILCKALLLTPIIYIIIIFAFWFIDLLGL